jgi:hypothetical protein
VKLIIVLQTLRMQYLNVMSLLTPETCSVSQPPSPPTSFGGLYLSKCYVRTFTLNKIDILRSLIHDPFAQGEPDFPIVTL